MKEKTKPTQEQIDVIKETIEEIDQRISSATTPMEIGMRWIFLKQCLNELLDNLKY